MDPKFRARDRYGLGTTIGGKPPMNAEELKGSRT